MDTLTFVAQLVGIAAAFLLGAIAIASWREVRLADAANLQRAVEAGGESDDEIVGEHVTVPDRTH